MLSRKKWESLKSGDTVKVENLESIPSGTPCIVTEVRKTRQGETKSIMIDAEDGYGPFIIESGYRDFLSEAS